MAAPVSPREQALAEALFLEGKRLLLEGRPEQACPKLEESQRIDPAGGTLLMLALCLERQGKLASAWATFSSALSVAQHEHVAEREAVAKEHLAALEPRLSRLVVQVSPELRAKEGLVVRWDGVVFAEPSWGIGVPVDAGEHTVDAAWPGGPPLRKRVVVREEGGQVLVELALPLPEPAPAPPSASSSVVPPPAPRSPGGASRWPGYALLGGGALALLVGSVAGGVAFAKMRAVDRRCPGTRCADADAKRWNEDARWWADVATVSLPLGVIAVGGGSLLLWGGKAPRAGVGVGVVGSF